MLYEKIQTVDRDSTYSILPTQNFWGTWVETDEVSQEHLEDMFNGYTRVNRGEELKKLLRPDVLDIYLGKTNYTKMAFKKSEQMKDKKKGPKKEMNEGLKNLAKEGKKDDL